MAKVTFALRRRVVIGGQVQYLFLTSEREGGSFDNKIIAPALPGNDSTTIKGENSNNFIISLGIQQTTIRVAGFLVPMRVSQAPTLGGSNPTGVHSISGETTLVSDRTGKQLRDHLLRFIADMATATFDDFKLVWPDWENTVGSAGDVVIESVNCGLFEGMVRNFTWEQVEGEPDQYMFRFDFIVGDTGGSVPSEGGVTPPGEEDEGLFGGDFVPIVCTERELEESLVFTASTPMSRAHNEAGGGTETNALGEGRVHVENAPSTETNARADGRADGESSPHTEGVTIQN